MFRDQRGMTLIEISIAMTIVALLLGGLLGTVALMQKQLPKGSAQLAVENRHQLARYWITRDANSANTFTAGTSTTYGTFSWSDFTGSGGAPAPTPTPTPATTTPATVTVTTQSDFEAAGTTRTNLDTATIPGDMFLLKGTTPGASFSANAAQAAALGTGSNAFRRPNGLFLIFRGAATTANFDYDPVANTFTTRAVLSAAIGAGGLSFQRSNGTFVTVRGNSTNGTLIYDPSTNGFVTGPALSGNAGAGATVIPNTDGTFLIVHGNKLGTTSTYTPTGGTGGIGSTAAGPAVGVNVGAGAHAILKPDGNYLLIAGNAAQNTRIYNPGTKAFSAGNATGANVGAGAHSIQRPGNLFLVLTGANTNVSRIYDASANTFAAGPTVLGASQVNDGAHAYELADGKWRIIKADASNATATYDPVANTMAAGPTLVTTYTIGAISLQRPDGKYLTLQPTGATAGSLYDAGYFVSGQYNSEDFHPDGIVNWTTIEFDKTADLSIVVKVRTATSSTALQSATFRTIANSGDSIGAGEGETFLEVQIEYSRAMPSYPLSDTEVWRGSASTFYIRTFAQPDIQEIRLKHQFIPTSPPPPSQATLFETRYFYDSALKAVMREEKRDSVIVSVTQVAADILNQGDVSFTFDSAQRKMTVTITPTVQEAPAIGDISRTATLIGFLRPTTQPVAPTPTP